MLRQGDTTLPCRQFSESFGEKKTEFPRPRKHLWVGIEWERWQIKTSEIAVKKTCKPETQKVDSFKCVKKPANTLFTRVAIVWNSTCFRERGSIVSEPVFLMAIQNERRGKGK